MANILLLSFSALSLIVNNLYFLAGEFLCMSVTLASSEPRKSATHPRFTLPNIWDARTNSVCTLCGVTFLQDLLVVQALKL